MLNFMGKSTRGLEDRNWKLKVLRLGFLVSSKGLLRPDYPGLAITINFYFLLQTRGAYEDPLSLTFGKCCFYGSGLSFR